MFMYIFNNCILFLSHIYLKVVYLTLKIIIIHLSSLAPVMALDDLKVLDHALRQ